jgi:phenylalanyl-tRNA synthetase alpha chain
MMWDFDKLIQEACEEIAGCSDLAALEVLRIKFLGRKGFVADVYASLSTATVQEKPLIGKGANDFRARVTQLIKEKKGLLEYSSSVESVQVFDVTLPGIAPVLGQEHILSRIIEEICTIFEHLGFVVQDGPEIETEFNNFTALNIPADHPSRDSFDTFYLETPDPQQKDRNLLLRSQTSPVQIRLMKQFKPPFAVVIPGKVYRPDAVDASHSFVFSSD